MTANKKIFAASLVLAFSLAGPVTAHEGHRDHAAAAEQLAPNVALAPLAARYDLKVAHAKKTTQADWYLWRDANSIETANPVVGHNDIWQRSGANDYHYRRVFHHDKRVVDYTPGEIRTRNAEPDWAKLASVISPQLLDALKRGSSKTLFGQKAVRYTGNVGGQHIDLWWLERAKLPASLQMIRSGERMTMALKEVHDVGPANWPRTSDDKIADYGMIDAADFGDMESDPFVAKVMQQDGHNHTH